MLSKNQVKSITALHHKKFRWEEKLFIAEGEKVVGDLLLSGWNVKSIFGVQQFFQNLPGTVRISKETEIVLVTDIELGKISMQSAPQNVLAIAEIPPEKNEINFKAGLKLVLDGINDPGNFGTIIRIADWFGIEEIICSQNSVDCFNPKVVQSSMGSLFRSSLFYRELTEILSKNKTENNLPVFGTVLEGKNIFEEKLSADGFIIIGNESSGISNELLSFISTSLTIPNFGKNNIDSLNVAVATGIVCAEFRKRLAI